MTARKYANIAALIAIAFLAGSLVTGGKGCEWKPGPVEPVVKAPFKTDKLAVLIVEETAQRGSYTPGQRAAILSTAPGSLIATIKARGGEYRILDKDQTNFANDAQWVKEAFAVPHPELPWIVAAGSVSGVSQKLPDNAVKLLEAVK